MFRLLFTVLYFVTFVSVCFSQKFSGRIYDAQTNEYIEFTEIGIKNHSIGVISDIDGRYAIDISQTWINDTIRISHVGYLPLEMTVKDYADMVDKDIKLTPKDNFVETIVVDHKKFKPEVLGNKFDGEKFQGGFIQNMIGFECGVLLKINKKAILNKLIINVTDCAYEKIYYRVNVYRQKGKNSFENILSTPIYVQQHLPNNQKTELVIDLSQYYVHVEGNTLITLQQIANLGMGQLLISGSAFSGNDSYYRTSSQDKWVKSPIKLAFRVESIVEK